MIKQIDILYICQHYKLPKVKQQIDCVYTEFLKNNKKCQLSCIYYKSCEIIIENLKKLK